MKMLEVKLIEIEPEKSKSGIPMKRAISPGNRPIAQGVKKIKDEGVGNARAQVGIGLAEFLKLIAISFVYYRV